MYRYYLRGRSGDNNNDHCDRMIFSVVLPGCGRGTGEVGSDLQHQDGRDGEIPESHPPWRPGQETQPVPEQRWEIPLHDGIIVTLRVNHYPYSWWSALSHGEKYDYCTEVPFSVA